MGAEEILTLAVPVTFLAMLGAETAFPARPFPKIRGWRWIGILGFVLFSAIGVVLPMLLPLEWLAAHRLIDATGLGIPLGVACGYAVVSLAGYGWHRALHRVDFLWRWFHQMHHAPQRLDMPGAMYFHPLDMIGFTLVPTLVLTLVIGLDPLAAAIVGYVATFYALFQHWNVKTPQWLGYLIQRPESHSQHHELDVHASNYSDFPIWDIVFGTFKNPKTFEGRVGFAQPAPLGKLLLGIDVNAEVATRGGETMGDMADVATAAE